jgi:ATP/maltotriose-dependent transcriptional regulator MalT
MTDSQLEKARQAIDSARRAIAKGTWDIARSEAERSLGLVESAEAHELLGLACWWLSDAETMFDSRERAYRLYRDRGDVRRAARMATWLDWDYRAFRGESAVANGWLRRARRLLEGHEDSAEYGWLLEREADARLSSDAEGAAAQAAAAAELGRKHGDPDLEFIALSLQGLAQVTAGRVRDGMHRLDEATAAVVAGEMVDPSAAGVTCCHLIAACELVRDFDRAGQWCARVRDYCRRWNHPPLLAVCRTQYAGVLISRGDWRDAEAELSAALGELGALRPGWVGLGHVRLAELRRRQGRLEEAESLYRRFEAAPEGTFGLAAVALDQRNPAEAERLARRVLRGLPAGNHGARAAALELIVLAAAAGGRPDSVSTELEELRRLATTVQSDALLASARLATGATAHARGERDPARIALDEATRLFERAEAPFDGLRARLLLAEALQADGAAAAARTEATAVATRARALGAEGLARQAEAFVEALAIRPGAQAARSPLTAREREVLRHVANGLTNRQLANRLSVSEHTIHRHLGNIFTKLGLTSRAAAVAFALKNGIA